MSVPQTNRQPIPLTNEEIRRELKRRRQADKSDPFATDPNSEINQLGRLALRREDINDLFALGDLCAQLVISDDNRLRIFYVGKTLMAYRKAFQVASNDVDTTTARRALREFSSWVVKQAQNYPTQRNLAVALWAISSDEVDEIQIPPMSNGTVENLLALFANPNVQDSNNKAINNTNNVDTPSL